jgi:hypothetical protein
LRDGGAAVIGEGGVGGKDMVDDFVGALMGIGEES